MSHDIPHAGSAMLIACGALAREVTALTRLNGWGGRLAVTCLPASLHNRPQAIPGRVRAAIHAARRRGFRRVFVAYGDCGTGGALDRVLAEEGAPRLPGDHCYAFYTGVEAFAALAAEELGTFYLTDYLVRHFDALVIRGLGLDRHPELREPLFGRYTRVAHLAQRDDPALAAAAERAAAQIGLPCVRRFTGFGALADFVGAAASPPAIPSAGPTLPARTSRIERAKYFVNEPAGALDGARGHS